MVRRPKKFPQADSIDKILYIIKQFDEDELKEKEYLAKSVDIAPRQVDYYLDALIFLDIVDEEYNYTETAVAIISADTEQKKLHLRNLIINRPVFKSVYKSIMHKKAFPDRKTIAYLIQQYFDLNDMTAERRSSTVVKWIKWIKDNKMLYTAHYYN